jgi:hypothetical protein
LFIELIWSLFQRRYGPAGLQTLLLSEDDHDTCRPDRKAASVRILENRRGNTHV